MTGQVFMIRLALLIGVVLILALVHRRGAFSCRHSRTTFPQRPRSWALGSFIHVTCLDCGREFTYDWESMARGTEIPRAPAAGWLEESGAVPASAELRRRYAAYQD